MTGNKKILKAVAPFIHPEFLNFKTAPYEAWRDLGGMTAKNHYPIRALHGPVFRRELPTLWKSRKEARLRFVEPISLLFDTFPDYARYEIVPMFWDCWPGYFDMVCAWLRRHKVQTAIFSSRQTAELIGDAFPEMNIIWCPEAVDASCYDMDKPLVERTIDLLEFGRSNEQVIQADVLDKAIVADKSVCHVCTRQNGKFIYTNEQLYQAMGDAKVTIALPRSMTDPATAGNIETLTQRYWECMFSRMVMVGHAPQELIDFIGYNPVIELRDDISAENLIIDVLEHIEDYQELVDKNLATAQRLGSWTVRMSWLMEELNLYYIL
jgi:hypothetical protein